MIAEVRLRICVCCLLGVMPGFILSRLSPLYVPHSLSAVCLVPRSPLLSPSLSHRSVVCHPPRPPGCQLCLIASAAAATLCSANKLHFDFRFPLATCRLPHGTTPFSVLPLLLATCHRGPSGAVGVHYASVFPHSNRSKSAPENVLRHRNNFY